MLTLNVLVLWAIMLVFLFVLDHEIAFLALHLGIWAHHCVSFKLVLLEDVVSSRVEGFISHVIREILASKG